MSMGGAGAGFMLDAINKLKYNRSLLKGKSYYDLAERYQNAQRRAGLVYSEATPEEIQKLRQSLIRDRQREQIRKGIALVLSIAILMTIGWLGNWAIHTWFI